MAETLRKFCKDDKGLFAIDGFDILACIVTSIFIAMAGAVALFAASSDLTADGLGVSDGTVTVSYKTVTVSSNEYTYAVDISQDGETVMERSGPAGSDEFSIDLTDDVAGLADGEYDVSLYMSAFDGSGSIGIGSFSVEGGDVSLISSAKTTVSTWKLHPVRFAIGIALLIAAAIDFVLGIISYWDW